MLIDTGPTLREVLGNIFPYLPLLPIAAFVIFIVFMGLYDSGLLDFLRSGSSRVAAKFTRGDAVIGYKVANLTSSGFTGVSGGGSYDFLSEGKLNPGFHCFRSISKLRSSSYIGYGSVILEVLLYGEIAEYDDGYIGSSQRVLQVIPNGDGVGYCYSCNRRDLDLYVNRDQLSSAQGYYFYRSHGWESFLICKTCMKITNFVDRFKFRRRNSSEFIPFEDYLLEANRDSGNPFPIGYVRELKELNPTVLQEDSLAR